MEDNEGFYLKVKTSEHAVVPAQVWGGGISPAATSPSSLPPQLPPGPLHVPTMPCSGSERPARPSQQDRAPSPGSAATFSPPQLPTWSHGPPPPAPTERPPPPRLAPILKKRGPPREASMALLRLQKQQQEPGRRSSPVCRSQAPPTARGGACPPQPRLWAPPTPKRRCDPTTLPKQPCDRQTSDSSSQVSHT